MHYLIFSCLLGKNDDKLAGMLDGPTDGDAVFD